jgi:hypothetical protein
MLQILNLVPRWLLADCFKKASIASTSAADSGVLVLMASMASHDCAKVRPSRYRALCMALTAEMRSGPKPRRRKPSKFIERAPAGWPWHIT